MLFIFQGFMADCPDGRMDRDKMKQMFNTIKPEVKTKTKILKNLSIIFRMGQMIQNQG